MRIVIDMQGAQTESRFRGIGRYTLGFVRGVIRNRGEHEIILALSGLFPETIEPIRAAFDGLLPQENIRVWYAPGPVMERDPGNEARRETAELVREAFLASLQPHVIHITSLFEGYIDGAVTSIGKLGDQIPTSVTLYDLIPLVHADKFLDPNPRYAIFYRDKLLQLRKAERLLAISEFSAREAISELSLSETQVINVSASIEPHLLNLDSSDDTANSVNPNFRLRRQYVLYTGGGDEHKNLSRLIQAYGSLGRTLRDEYQLVFAGRMPAGVIEKLQRDADLAGLEEGELFFTGYVSDHELVQLYKRCRLFVLPSLREGFGLPAVEAMACGAPVIGANAGSLLEVIGLPDALFDPMDVSSITQKMRQVLEDETFRGRLCDHGREQSKRFSWDITAKRAIAVWSDIRPPLKASYSERAQDDARLLTLISGKLNLRNEAAIVALAQSLSLNKLSGIERQLFVDISELCQRDAATGVQRVVRSYLKWLLKSPPKGFRVEPVFAEMEIGYRYARRYIQEFLGLEEFGLSDEPIRWQRGDIFLGLDMQHHVQLAHRAFYSRLRQDGVTVKFLVYDLLPIQFPELFPDSSAKLLHENWLSMIASTDGAVCISKATSDTLLRWIDDSGIHRAPNFQSSWVHIGADLEGSVPSQGFPSNADEMLSRIGARQSFLAVSTLEPRKYQHQILEAAQLLWEDNIDVNLVFVGQQGWRVEDLVGRLRRHPELGRRLFWLQGISDEYLTKVYQESTCLVAASINEGFGLPLVEAAQRGIPVIARDIPVFREVAGDNAYFFSGETADDLATALRAWLALYRQNNHPKSIEVRWHTWEQSAEILKYALITRNYPRRQLLVDVSELVKHDARTGIQRVVRNVLRQWLTVSSDGWRVEPVYAVDDQPYRYARRFTADFLGGAASAVDLEDRPIEYSPGDIFFALDLQPQTQVSQASFYQLLRRHGVSVFFMIYDLLPLNCPEFFPSGTQEGFERWLSVVGESDGALCISKAVATELSGWIRERSWGRYRSFRIEWTHLGSDIESSAKSRASEAGSKTLLSKLKGVYSFVMVGTLEPRKAHRQVLGAFELLWEKDLPVNLVIVGKRGWLVDDLVDRITTHSEYARRLTWLENLDDDQLELLYLESSCLIAASYGEGFGLPIFEAANRRLPVIARALPVFREIAGENVHYFEGLSPADLALSVESWLALYAAGGHPDSANILTMTWAQAAENIKRFLGSW
jgi:glycosyltransferase involved in cell wall biosynthesis